jgi:CheY-like chemotaxis protein
MPLTILIVEDNSELLDLLVRAIRRLGDFIVEGKLNGISGWQRVQELHPDCIIVDLTIPGITGSQLIQQIRANPQTSAIPIIIMSALPESEVRQTGILSLANAYLTKPTMPQTIVTTILQLVNQSGPDQP